MTGRWFRLTALVVLAPVAGCPGDFVGDSDAPDATRPDGDAADGSPPGGGLIFEFRSQPRDFPADVGGPFQVQVRTATLVLRDFVALGDAAPGDDRTRLAELTLRWDEDNEPDDVLFLDAPPGYYSRVEARIVDYDFSGALVIDGMTETFEVEDEDPLPVVITMQGAELKAGEPLRIRLELDLGVLLDPVDWSVLPVEDGDVILSSGDPQLDALRARFSTAFDVEGKFRD